ncbi:hypothetical protein BST97_04285 [Nonlabens spongiae]|uniref:Uncharacterized protein n=1 Tax=Nonlabens spongiae TaxID=331648 RepID=A0A1W6MI49_9FLAO|nr:hypothetical protein [Nonlabens spongiae]ARN77260.1 hypothetical protein BST97_04285 [Nonlabens spongiae]
MNDLLDKYWEGTLSLEEENKLRDYFKSDQVSAEHEPFRDLFDAFDEEAAHEGTYEFDAFAKVDMEKSLSEVEVLSDYKAEAKGESQSSPAMWKGLAIAAGFSFLIALGAGFFQTQQEDLGTYDDPEQAFAATMDALELVSKKFNDGKENLAPAAEFNKKVSKVFKLDN